MNAPERIYRISETQLSIARHYGGAKVFGVEYVYDPSTDTLIRADVLKVEQKAKRDAERLLKKQNKAIAEEQQGGLFA